MAESTTEPRIPALQRPITSSMTNSTAEIGALNAAANPAAAPTGASKRRRSRERSRPRPNAEARLAPICSDGFSYRSAERNVSVIDIERRLRLIDAAAPHQRENMDHQQSNDEADDRR